MDIVERLQDSSGQLDGLCDEAADEIERLRGALAIAATALDIADDWNLPAVQVEPPKEWCLDGGREDAADGWCSTRALANKLRELATPNAKVS